MILGVLEIAENTLHQEWPTEEKLKNNMNLGLNELGNRLKDEHGLAYAYVLTTIGNVNGEFVQTGCAPNFEGGLLTLCACKHFMRTWRSVPEWRGVWVAGFAGINVTEDRRNHLFYLMKVDEAFPSHRAIWQSLLYARTHKNTQVNPLGDIYQPTHDLRDEFNYLDYYPPIKSHVHACNNLWQKDICYVNKRTSSRPALLVGDRNHSYLWSRPILHFREGRHPRTKKWNIQGLISFLNSK